MPEHDDDLRDLPAGITRADLELPPMRAVASLTTRDTDELLDIAKARAADASIFDDKPPVFWRVEASSQVEDFYHTMMMESTLKNYARDASDGVAFQDSHITRGMQATLGYTLRGSFKRKTADSAARTLIDCYTIPDLSEQTREFVDRMRAGLARDVSVGFKNGRMMCSICGKQMFRWWRSNDRNPCYHMPGVEYDLTDDEGNPTGKRKMAIGQIEDAGLTEVSTVYDGATPNAGLLGLKARMLADAGMLLPEQRGQIAARFGLQLPGYDKLWPGVAPQEERTMPATEEKVLTQADIDAAVRDAIAKERETSRQRLVAALKAAGREVAEGEDFVSHIDALGARVRELEPLASAGRQYRSDLIDEVVEEGVRAFGGGEEPFDEDGERAELESLSIERIKARKARYAKLASNVFGEGGRGTEETGARQNGTQPVKDAPASIESRRRRSSQRIYRG